MGAFRITVVIGDPHGQRFEPVEMLVDTGATFTKAPRELLEGLGLPVESTYTAELADGSRIERTRGRAMIRLQGKEYPTPITFGEAGEQSLLGSMVLEDAMLAVDPHAKRLMPVNALEMTEGPGIPRPDECNGNVTFGVLVSETANRLPDGDSLPRRRPVRERSPQIQLSEPDARAATEI